jgi:hypothetical protein
MTLLDVFCPMHSSPDQCELFLTGPVPWPWLERAGALPGKALHVAVRLWHEVGLTRTLKVSISMTGMARMGISRFAASRGLSALEGAGLVTVVRHAGRKPQVVVVATTAALSSAAVVAAGDERSSELGDEPRGVPPGAQGSVSNGDEGMSRQTEFVTPHCPSLGDEGDGGDELSSFSIERKEGEDGSDDLSDPTGGKS